MHEHLLFFKHEHYYLIYFIGSISVFDSYRISVHECKQYSSIQCAPRTAIICIRVMHYLLSVQCSAYCGNCLVHRAPSHKLNMFYRIQDWLINPDFVPIFNGMNKIFSIIIYDAGGIWF